MCYTAYNAAAAQMRPQCLLCKRPARAIPCFCCQQLYCDGHLTAHDALCAQVLTSVHCLAGHSKEQYEELAFVSQQFYRFRYSAELLSALREQRRFVLQHFRIGALAAAQIDLTIDKCAFYCRSAAAGASGGQRAFGCYKQAFGDYYYAVESRYQAFETQYQVFDHYLQTPDCQLQTPGSCLHASGRSWHTSGSYLQYSKASPGAALLLTATGESQRAKSANGTRNAVRCSSASKAVCTQASALRRANSAELTYYRHYSAILHGTAVASGGQSHYQQLMQLNSVNYALSRGDLTGAKRLAVMKQFDYRVPELLRQLTLFQTTEEVQNATFLTESDVEALVKFEVDESVLFTTIFLAFYRFAAFLSTSALLQRSFRSQVHRFYALFNEVMHKVSGTTAGDHVRVVFLAFSWLFCRTIVDPQRLQKVAFRALSFASQLRASLADEVDYYKAKRKRPTPVCLIYNEFYDTFELLSTLKDCFLQLDIDAKIQDLTAHLDCARDISQRQESFEAANSLLGSRMEQQAADLLQECCQVDTMLRLALQDAKQSGSLLAEADL